MLDVTGFLIVLLLIVVVTYLWYIRQTYTFFTKLNIPGPPPVLFFGNFLDVFKSRRLSLNIQQWTQKYGRIFGYFEGHTPILVISDPDILQNIFIKSFSKFHSRRLFPLSDENAKRVSLFLATGLRWKRQRFILNPTFSSAKLKQMTPLVHQTTSMLMKKMAEEEKKGEPFDIYAYFKRFTMDTIWSCAFGVDTDMQNNVDDPYLIHSQAMFGDKVNERIIVLLALFITELNLFWRAINLSTGYAIYWIREHFPITQRFLSENPTTWIIRQTFKIMKKKDQDAGETKRIDLLQLMLESASNEDYIQV